MIGRCIALLLSLSAVFGYSAPSNAHRPSDAFLSMAVAGSSVEGRWDIALRDLEHAIGLDSDRDGAVTWGELKSQHAAVAAYALARLSLESEARTCPARVHNHLIEQRSDGTYAVLLFTADCTASIATLTVAYDLLFDLDPLHRGLAQVEFDGKSQSLVFSPGQRHWTLGREGAGRWQQALSYLREGVWHIWIGFDHILFLVSLLLPAVLRREAGRWQPSGSLRQTFIDVAKVVTAFTVAHSITLGLATLGWVDLPSRPVEMIIAASIVLAALNNIYPLVTRGLWAVAFGFGLIHGLGFAGALEELGLPAEALLLSLLSFNAGVELGQVGHCRPVPAAGLRVASLPVLSTPCPAAWLCCDRRGGRDLAGRAWLRGDAAVLTQRPGTGHRLLDRSLCRVLLAGIQCSRRCGFLSTAGLSPDDVGAARPSISIP